jgi:acyl carrier protein
VPNDAITSNPMHDTIFNLLSEVLSRKLTETGATPSAIDPETSLLATGLVDSNGLLDILLEVEDRSGCRFDPLRIDFESGATLRGLTDAF